MRFIVTVNATMLAARLLCLQRTFKPPRHRVGHESGALGTYMTLTNISREQEWKFFHTSMFVATVDLYKFTDQPDIFFYMPRERFHGWHHASHSLDYT